ncbi:Zn-binding Pro-Ala-Ala-Arg (PAAR) domain-containing protein, incolved in TypeVI secretion [Paraburkholderia fungorum]|uniref:Zn-binding Pro-Ala-Ala-Arg (PAAR) domain-containing protein, incolved in TypeVI secretion n=1 Tax=Paraburkholderia fungorum TaxID=134537 RepID=A0A1H1A9L7_9BURK|nr:PAAR domain-containing protein [Paraburkholderia fungorum]SDQ36438.1 Zn-binding Pro-Ala-Ala-Arg (PAAR) domain-containing protein, incolved in TypeVI secretion [Paraburkholderia fungorum]
MNRHYLRIGDKSSVGGTIVEGIPQILQDGKQVSFVGAAVSCPACKSTGKIAAKGQRWPGEVMGKQLALEDDLCVCKCYPLPIMVAGQSAMHMGFESNGGAVPASATPIDSGHGSEHWVRFELKDRGSCEGLKCRAQFSDGSVAKGVVDSQNRIVFHRPNASACKTLDVLLENDSNGGSAVTEKLLAAILG